jgi:hypothetical protein
MSSSGEQSVERQIPVTMKNRQNSLFLLLVILVTGIAHAGPALFKDAFAKGETASTPAPGSTERRAILDAMRLKIKELHELDVIFIVKTMNVSKGWAWVHTMPRSKDGGSMYEDFYALLHKENGRWTIAEIPCTEPDNPECLDSPGYFRKLFHRFPGMPSFILPVERP